MKQVDLGSLPPCSLSIYCLRLLDDLDEPGIKQKLEQVSSTGDVQDERLLDQLRMHLSGCPTCAAVIAQARRVRTQQRAILGEFLIESEASVPSTASQIFAAIRQEQLDGQRPGSSGKKMGYYLFMTPGAQKLNGASNHRVEPRSTKQLHSWLWNALTLATVATVILVAVGMFDHFFNRQVPARHGQTHVIPNDWSSVVVGLTLVAPGVAKLMGIDNYNPANGQHVELVPSSRIPADVRLEGVAPDGHNLLYRFSTSGHTFYSTLGHTSFFYELNDDNAGNAIWMDNDHALVATRHDGVVQVNIHTGASTDLFPALQVDHLRLFHAPYLYFTGPAGPGTSALYRININASDVAQVVTMYVAGTDYWLSPDGSTIYYTPSEQYGAPRILSISGDGAYAGESVGVTPAGYIRPVGFAADNSLEAMRISSGKFQVIKYEASGQQLQVILDDAAPGAVSLCGPGVVAIICDSNISFAPNGHGLVVNAFYKDGHQQLWFDDLTTRKPGLLLTLDRNTDVQLPGWDRIPVAA